MMMGEQGMGRGLPREVQALPREVPALPREVPAPARDLVRPCGGEVERVLCSRGRSNGFRQRNLSKMYTVDTVITQFYQNDKIVFGRVDGGCSN